MTYDAARNTIAMPNGSRYYYDAENHLLSTAGVNYTYDGDGNRIEKLSSGSVVKIYWYGSGTEILDETDGTGSTANSNFNEYIFFGATRIVRRDASGNVFYYLEDHLGSSRVIVQAGQTSPRYDADFCPFGGEIVHVNGCSQNYKFESKERDPESGLDDFGARFYNPGSPIFPTPFGRFLSADWSSVPAPVPYANLANPQTLNLYAMVSDNPETFADLDGHFGASSDNQSGSNCETAGNDIPCSSDFLSDQNPPTWSPDSFDPGWRETIYYVTHSSGSTSIENAEQKPPQKQQTQNPTEEQIRAELSSLASAYGVPVAVVMAVAETESSLNVNAQNENTDSNGNVTTDYGLMQINSGLIGHSVTGSDGQSFKISDTVETDWKANANAGVALLAGEYKAAVKAQPNGTAETRAQQTYSGYNGGPGARNRYTLKNKAGNDFKDKRDKHFLNNYRAQNP